MGNRKLPPPVYGLDNPGLVQYGKDNYGLELNPEADKQALVSQIQDARQAIPDGQDPAAGAVPDEIPFSAPDQSPPPREFTQMKAEIPPQPAIEGEAPEPGRTFEPGPGDVPLGDPAATEPQRVNFQPGPPEAKEPMVDSDPPLEASAIQDEQLDIPDEYTMPDFENDDPPDKLDALRARMSPKMANQGPKNKIFRHPSATSWLFNPLTGVYWKPTETLMQNRELVPVMGDPPVGSNIGTA